MRTQNLYPTQQPSSHSSQAKLPSYILCRRNSILITHLYSTWPANRHTYSLYFPPHVQLNGIAPIPPSSSLPKPPQPSNSPHSSRPQQSQPSSLSKFETAQHTLLPSPHLKPNLATSSCNLEPAFAPIRHPARIPARVPITTSFAGIQTSAEQPS